MRFFKYGNKAALIVGILLMIADSFFSMAHDFGAWLVGCLFCVWYSASAIREDERINKKLKGWLYAYLVIVLVSAFLLYESTDTPSQTSYGSIQSSLKAMGFDGR